MATSNESESTSTTGTSTEETSGQEQQGQQQSTTPETGGQEQQQPSNEKPAELPNDHPLVKTLATQKAALATQKSEITELRATSAKVTQLEDELKARPTKEAVDTLQTRYDRLEQFLQAAGGPLGKALDSRTFTKSLFESDKDVESIVKDWNKANPTATSQALSSAAGEPSGKKPVQNDLLRAAIK